MGVDWLLMSVLVCCLVTSCPATDNYQPEQIHLSYLGDATQMAATWNTGEMVDTVVQYGPTLELEYQVEGQARLFTQGGRNQTVHRARMTDLTPGDQYFYRVGGSMGWSEIFRFKALPSGAEWSPRLAVYGDLGVENAQSLPRLQTETQQGMYDAILHVGDFAYDMNDNQGETGDEFMRQIQSIAAYLPYMTCVGNHEQAGNFTNYKSRFTMPGEAENMFFSFDLGPVHFISVSSEYYYFTNYGIDQAFTQYNWLKQDLQAATRPEVRSQRPWIVVYGHRPMYCTNLDMDDCTRIYDKLRVGIPDQNVPGLEDLLLNYGVDLAIWAHEHSYERLWPIYNYTVYNGTQDNPYRNPGAPVHITTGSAGCKERHDSFGFRTDWTAFRTVEYGYTRMTFHNTTHMHMEQVSDDRKGKVIDSVWLVKDFHLPYSQLKQTEAGYVP